MRFDSDEGARAARILEAAERVLRADDLAWLTGRIGESAPAVIVLTPRQRRLARLAKRDLYVLSALGFFAGSPLHLAEALRDARRRPASRYVPTGGREWHLRRVLALSGGSPLSVRTLFNILRRERG